MLALEVEPLGGIGLDWTLASPMNQSDLRMCGGRVEACLQDACPTYVVRRGGGESSGI